MSNVDVAKAELKDWLKRKLLPKKKVHYDEPPIAQKTFFPVKRKTQVQSEKDRFGGVVIHQGKVLLVNPTNNFGNYAWTFPKGGATKGETPEEAAVREVEEESGYICKVVREIAGKFAGTTSDNKYFLMRPIKQGQHGWETEQVDWATFDQAKKMIMQTGIIGNMTGMKRDLNVLYAAFGKELFPEELKEIEKRASDARREQQQRDAMRREQELRDKLGDEGYLQFKAYQAEVNKRMAQRRAAWADYDREKAKRKSELKAQRQEELLRFRLGDEGYEKYKQFMADREAERLAALKAKFASVKYTPHSPGLPSSTKIDPRCWRCNGTRFETKKIGNVTVNTCQDCGSQWLDRPPLPAVKKPERWVQKKFDWPKEGK